MSNYIIWWPFWQPHWILWDQEISKWVHIYTIVFVNPTNVQTDNKQTSKLLSLISYESNYEYKYVLTEILAAILDFSKRSMMRFLHHSDLESMGSQRFAFYLSVD